MTDLGADARLIKVDISQAFSNVKIDPTGALHLGILWRDKFYLDPNLAFGAVNGMAFFERITDLSHFVMAKRLLSLQLY